MGRVEDFFPAWTLRLACVHARLLSAGWFTLLGLGVAGSMFLVPAIPRGKIIVLLYVILPAMSSGIVGYGFGTLLLNQRKPSTLLRTLLLGLLITLATVLLFSLLFSVTYLLTMVHQALTLRGVLGLLVTTAAVGMFATAPLVIPVGVLGTCALYLFGRVACNRADPNLR
jgi:hypothetical protein